MDEFQRLAQNLQSVKYFQHLSILELRDIVSAGQVRRFRAGETLFFESQPSAGMHVLVSGMVHLFKIGPQGQENIILVVRPVTMFNEVTVLDGSENPVCARAVQDCLVWKIAHEPFQKILLRHPEIAVGLLKVLASRNRQLISRYEDLSFRPVQARTAKLLLELSQNGQHPIARREHSISQMAAQIASVPEAVSRALGELARRELICSTRTEIRVLNVRALGDAAQLDAPPLE
jgi:CRP-like cAMP-binding protein